MKMTMTTTTRKKSQTMTLHSKQMKFPMALRKNPNKEGPRKRREQLLEGQKVPPDDIGRKIKKMRWERNFEKKWRKGVCPVKMYVWKQWRGILMHESGKISRTKWGICRSAIPENENCWKFQRLSVQFFLFLGNGFYIDSFYILWTLNWLNWFEFWIFWQLVQ